MLFSTAPGIYLDMPIDQYHRDPAIGSSKIKTMASKTPAHCLLDSNIDKATADWGTAMHMAVLEPARFLIDVVRGPDNRRGNAWKDAVEEAGTKTLLTSGDYDECLVARDAVHRNHAARELIENAANCEASYFVKDEETGLMLKARPDLTTKDAVVVDLKTTQSVDANSFARDVAKFLYHLQEAHYTDVVIRANSTSSHFAWNKFVFLCVEKTFPYFSAIFELDADTVREACNLRHAALRRIKECQEANHWPGYPEGKQIIRIPNYAFKTLTFEGGMFGQGISADAD